MMSALEWLGAGEFGHWGALLRLLGAAVLGGVIGLEREASGKPAGFRTNLLICLGSALIMELSIGIAALATPESGFRGDPGRIGAQIVSGIGFLGAGTILHFRGSVIGLTTAATLWVVAGIGMAVGARAYLEAVVATALVIFALRFLDRVEDRLIPRRPTDRTIDLVLVPDTAAIGRAEELLIRTGLQVGTLKVEKNSHAYLVSLQARGDRKAWDRVIHELLNSADVQKVEMT
jgi:putative Mg2+ transporter-C (MgtC) family protein